MDLFFLGYSEGSLQSLPAFPDVAGKRPRCSIIGNIPGAISMLAGSTCVELIRRDSAPWSRDGESLLPRLRYPPDSEAH
jgi:hypothetical protein